LSCRRSSRLIDSGTSGPAATPCTTRAPTSSGMFWANAHSTEVSVNAARLTA
jgi:hypothetical protein